MITSYTHLLRRAVAPALLATLLSTGLALAAGGTFGARNSGTAQIQSGCGIKSCTVTLSGTGKASYMGSVKEAATLTGKLTHFPCGSGSGTVSLTSATTPANSITASVTGQVCLKSGALQFNTTYTITGGTGAFSKAAGSGTITGSATFSKTYSDTWKGTLTY